jgi:protein TonB
MHHAAVFDGSRHGVHGLRAYVAASLVLHLALLFAIASYKPESKTAVAYRVRLMPPLAPQVMPVPPVREALPPEVMEGPAVPEALERPGSAGTRAGNIKAPAPMESEGEGSPSGVAPGIDALFDTAVLDRRAVEPVKDPHEETGVTFDTTEMMLSGYMGLLKQKIEAIWHYPRDASEAGIYGDLRIRFVIRRDGTLGSVRLMRTSGHTVLDQAALKALRDAEPYWPLPDGFEEEALTINGRFIYTLSGWYVR